MPRLREVALDGAEDAYGWCGLCHSFTGFPHECAGEIQPVTEGAAQPTDAPDAPDAAFSPQADVRATDAIDATDAAFSPQADVRATDAPDATHATGATFSPQADVGDTERIARPRPAAD